jgi:hypothetical protein
MARIEWSALHGDEVEAVVSNLLYNEVPHAMRIRPSQGDFGIDVLAPHPGNPSVRDVYQIKKFALNLDSTQKTQIENSFKRFLIGLVKRKYDLGDWYLMMPLDPTPENQDWFELMPGNVVSEVFDDVKYDLSDAEKDRIKEWVDSPDTQVYWKGWQYCEYLAAKYPFVQDYYLHGGTERLRAAVSEVAKIVGLHNELAAPDATSVLQPGDLYSHLDRLRRVLDGDPHFTYGLSLDPTPPDIRRDDGAIAATQTINPDGSAVTFRIYARFDEALNERPVPIKLEFTFADGSPESLMLYEWMKYGKTTTLPAMIELDLPGGLGTEQKSEATATISPADGQETYERRLRVASPTGKELAVIPLSMVSTSGLDGTGAWAEGIDPAGILTVQFLTDLDDQTMITNFALGEPFGKEIVEVLPVLTLLSYLHAPNVLEMGNKFGPFSPGQPILNTAEMFPPELLAFTEDLASIQRHTSVPITFPENISGRDIRTTSEARSLLDGQVVVARWKKLHFNAHDGMEIDPGFGHQVAIWEPLILDVNGVEIELGLVRLTALSANLSTNANGGVDVTPRDNDTLHKQLDLNPPGSENGKRPLFARRI